LQGIDPALEEAAMDLGATPLQAFWLIIVPYLMPAIVAGALMAFTLSFDEYIVSIFTSGSESQTPALAASSSRISPRTLPLGNVSLLT
jgi:spermidine/putrescine transport system permease protein